MPFTHPHRPAFSPEPLVSPFFPTQSSADKSPSIGHICSRSPQSIISIRTASSLPNPLLLCPSLMMPGLRSFGRVGVTSPTVVDPVPALRSARVPTTVDLRRQLQQQTPPQYSQPSTSQRPEPDRPAATLSPFAQTSQVIRQLGQQPAVQDAVTQEHQSLAESRYSGGSSGSEHEPNSEYLTDLVTNFMDVMEDHRVGPSSLNGEDEEDDVTLGRVAELSSSIQALGSCASALESSLYSDVLCAIQLSCTGSSPSPQDPDWSTQVNGSAVRRAVMSRLRSAGYNAAVCKSRWDHSRGFPGGDYEYIDVVFSKDSSPVPRERLIVDLDFRAQFQVARPTPQFEAALKAAPVVFVGRADRLQQLVEALADACRKSLRVQGMHLPPWRKVEYLRAKWLAPYKRTTNPTTAHPVAHQQQAKPKPSSTHIPSAVVAAPFQSPSSFGFIRPFEAPALPPIPRAACVPVKRATSGAPRGSLGMLLQEQMGRKPSPVM